MAELWLVEVGGDGDIATTETFDRQDCGDGDVADGAYGSVSHQGGKRRKWSARRIVFEDISCI